MMKMRRMSQLNLKICRMKAAPTLKEKIQTKEERPRMAKEKLSSALLLLRRKRMKRKKLQGDPRSSKVAQKRSMMQAI